ncbi:MAG: hypothetical protein WBO44_03340 [Saprospiraceae bacterium]
MKSFKFRLPGAVVVVNACKISNSTLKLDITARKMEYFLMQIRTKIGLLAILIIVTFTACHRGSGCPSEDAQVKTNKKGMPTKKSESGLFDKKTSKKMRLNK